MIKAKESPAFDSNGHISLTSETSMVMDAILIIALNTAISTISNIQYELLKCGLLVDQIKLKKYLEYFVKVGFIKGEINNN